MISNRTPNPSPSSNCKLAKNANSQISAGGMQEEWAIIPPNDSDTSSLRSRDGQVGSLASGGRVTGFEH